MSPLTLEPELASNALPHQPRTVSSGLAPTADVPTTRPKKAPPTCYVPCPGCGHLVLRAETRAGLQFLLDVDVPTYCVVWDNGAALPRLEPSRGYPVHQCGTRSLSSGAQGETFSCGESL